MGVPAVLILAVFFWLVTSCIKYWYFSKSQVKYTHKLDDEVLEEIRRPPPQFQEKIMKMQKEREKNFDADPNRFYDSQRIRDIRKGLDPDAPNKDEQDEPSTGSKEKSDGKPFKMNGVYYNGNGQPMNLFEELDMRKEETKKKGKTQSRFDRSMFEDPLSRLHRELQEERKKAAEEKKKAEVSVPEKESPAEIKTSTK